jgi:potassium-dependent mechanosensitive channel
MGGNRIRSTLMALAIACFPYHAMAQAPAAAAQGKPPAESAQAIEDQEKQDQRDIRAIPAKADSDEQFVNEVILRAQSIKDGSELRRQLESLSASVDNLNKGFRTDDYSKLPIQRLETLVEHWNFYQKRLDAWHKKLQKLTLPISADAAELSSRKKYWLSLREASADTLSPALLKRIDDLIAEINQAESALSAPLGDLIDLGQRGNDVAQKVEQGIGKSSQLIKSNDLSLLAVDSPGLWDAARSPRERAEGQLAENLQVELQYSKEYYSAYATRVAVIRGFFLLLLFLLLWLSWKSKSVISARPELAEYRNTLRRPFSAWMVLVAFGMIALQDDLPLMAKQIVLLIIWLPILRLLPRKAFKLVGPWVYMSAVFYAFGIVGYILSADELLFRIVLLVTNLLMLITMLWLVRRSSDLVKSYTGVWLKLIKAAVWLGFLAILTAIVSNLVGNVTMAQMLSQATIDSSYLALFLYTSISVLAGFLLFLFKGRASKLVANSQHASSVIGLLVKLYKLGLFIYWLIASLNMFRLWLPLRGIWQQLMAFSVEIGKFTITIESLLLFPISVYVAFWVAKTTRSVLSEDVFPNMDLPRGIGNSVSSILYYALIMVGFFIALAIAGFEISQLGMIISALGVGIGFGLNTVVNNFVSGLILMLERPVQPGDTIEVSGTTGTVREIGMRATTISTFDGADVVVPNGMLLSEKMINWTLSSDSRRIDIAIGIAYGSDPEKVLALLLDVARNTQGVSQHPAPTALFSGFGESALNFSVRAWTTSYNDSVFIRSDMAVRIYKALNAAGFEIPFPQRELHVRGLPEQVLKPLTGEL